MMSRCIVFSTFEVAMIEYAKVPSRGAWVVGIFLAASTGFAACASGEDDKPPVSATGGGAGVGGGGQDGGAGGTAGTGGDAGSGGTGAGGTNVGGSGGEDAGEGGPAGTTITQIANGTIADDTAVSVQGAVVMSQVFLVSKSNSTNSCLWGVFVSEPNLTETQPYSGLLVLSYGTEATVADGGTQAYCPMLGVAPSGSGIPDDLKPGDVVDISGTTAYYLASACTQAGDSQTKQRQLGQSTVTKTGTAAIPSAHTVTAQEIVQLASPTAGDQGFHDQWGGVKVRVANVTAVPQTVNGNPSVTTTYGEIILEEGLSVGDKIYYRGYAKAADVCYAAPTYADASQTFAWMDGFSYLNFCTWSLQPNSKCNDLNPGSEDCAGSGDPTTVCTHE